MGIWGEFQVLATQNTLTRRKPTRNTLCPLGFVCGHLTLALQGGWQGTESFYCPQIYRFGASSEPCQSWWGWVVTPGTHLSLTRGFSWCPWCPAGVHAIRKAEGWCSLSAGICLVRSAAHTDLSQLLSIARGAGCAQCFFRFGILRQNNFEELGH